MKKELFKEYLTNALNEKKGLLSQNSISEDDKALILSQVENLTSLIEKVDALEEDETTTEIIDDLKTTVSELGEKLQAINEKINQNQKEIEDNMENEYLKSQNSIHDFAESIRHAKTSAEFVNNWRECLLRNSITVEEGSEEAYLPEAVHGLIQDTWSRNASWAADLKVTGAKRYFVRVNTSDENDETSRAKGWKKGTTKVAQEINVAAKLLEAQHIYKLQSLDNQTIFESDEALISYVVGELVDMVIAEIKRCVLVGDGRLDNSDYKVNSFEAVAKTTSDTYTTVHTVGDAGTTWLIDDIRLMVDSIKNDANKPVYLFLSKSDIRTLSRVSASETSTPVYVGLDVLAEQCNVAKIYSTDLLGSDYKAVAFIPSEYYLVGENVLNPKLAQWEDYLTNTQYWRYECVAGGGINAPKSSAVLKNA